MLQLHTLIQQIALFKENDLDEAFKYNLLLIQLRRQARFLSENYYNCLSVEQIADRKKSDKLYIFGSGWSLNNISKEEWRRISEHDTMGFNAFIRQNWIPLTFHLVRGWWEGTGTRVDWKNELKELGTLISENKLYEKTIFLLQKDFFGLVSNGLVSQRHLPKKNPIFWYKTAKQALPTHHLSEGLVHRSGTLTDCINFGFCLGWKEIILVGVDLYDTRYFWLNKNETFFIDRKTGIKTTSTYSDRGQRYDEAHSTISNGVLTEMQDWSKYLASYGTALKVYNPKSLLRQVLDVGK